MLWRLVCLSTLGRPDGGHTAAVVSAGRRLVSRLADCRSSPGFPWEPAGRHHPGPSRWVSQTPVRHRVHGVAGCGAASRARSTDLHGRRPAPPTPGGSPATRDVPPPSPRSVESRRPDHSILSACATSQPPSQDLKGRFAPDSRPRGPVAVCASGFGSESERRGTGQKRLRTRHMPPWRATQRADRCVRYELALMNQTLDEALAGQEEAFDAGSRWAVTWLEQSGFAEGGFGVAVSLSKAKNTSVAGMVEAGFLKFRGGKVTSLHRADCRQTGTRRPTRSSRRGRSSTT